VTCRLKNMQTLVYEPVSSLAEAWTILRRWFPESMFEAAWVSPRRVDVYAIEDRRYIARLEDA